MKTWLIADTHFGHANIIRHEKRPFENVEGMDEELIKRWNNKVSKDDKVYMLGDFTLSRSMRYITHLCSQLNGKKILIAGNHDTRKMSDYVQCGFVQATRDPLFIDKGTVLMHAPPKLDEVIPGVYYIYGHMHSKNCEVTGHPSCQCVSVELTNYEPIEYIHGGTKK